MTPDFTRRRWFMPAFSLLLGVLMFAAFAIGDEPGEGRRRSRSWLP